jgi:ATP-dependent DNA helicase HFM1/MER3
MASLPWDDDTDDGRVIAAAVTTRRKPRKPAAAARLAAPQPRACYTDSGTMQNCRLREVAELPACFRPVFSEFRYFNGVQSDMLDFVLSSSRSFVLSARPSRCLPRSRVAND